MNQKTIFTELMRKLFTTVLMIPAFVAVTAQTEKTRGFDDLYHFRTSTCLNTDRKKRVPITFQVIMSCSTAGGSSAMPTHRRRYQATFSRRTTPMRSGAPLMCRQTGR